MPDILISCLGDRTYEFSPETTALLVIDLQREFFFEQGYVVLPAAIDKGWVEQLRAGIAELVERSRGLTRSDGVFDLEAGHTAGAPRLRRNAFLDDLHLRSRERSV